MAYVYNTVDSTDLTIALGSAVPAAGSDVVINKFASQFANSMDLSVNDLLSFRITGGFTGAFTTDAILTVNQGGTGKIINEGGSKVVRIKAASGAGVLYSIENNPVGGGALYVGQGTVTVALNRNGLLSFSDQAIVTNLYTTGGTTDVPYNATALTLATMRGGSVLLRRDVTTLNVYAGVCTIDDSRVSPGTVTVEPGGTLNLRECGNITTLNANGGTIDLTGLTFPITITTLNIEPGVTIIKNVSTDSLLTVSTTNRPRGREVIVQR